MSCQWDHLKHSRSTPVWNPSILKKGSLLHFIPNWPWSLIADTNLQLHSLSHCTDGGINLSHISLNIKHTKNILDTSCGSYRNHLLYLGAFTYLWKAPVTFILSVCLSISLSACITSASTRWIFMKFGIGNFHKISPENPNLFTIKQNIWNFMWIPIYILLLLVI